MTEEPPGARDRLEGQRVDAGVRRARRPPERALHHARRPVTRRSRAEWEDPEGVPIDAILFGGRRSTVVPLVHEAFDWEHGVFLGATMSLGDDRRGGRRRSASCAATRSRCCRSAATTWPTTSRTGSKIGRARGREAAEDLLRQLVPQGRSSRQFLWPGFGENSRVLEWVFRRCDGAAEARRDADRPRADARMRSTPTASTSPTTSSRRSSPSTSSEWKAEIPPIREFFDEFGDRLPAEICSAARRAGGAPEQGADDDSRGVPARPDRRAHLRGARPGRPRLRGGASCAGSSADGDGDGSRARGAAAARSSARSTSPPRAARAPIAVRAFNPTLERARLRAAGLGGGDQHRGLAVPGRLRVAPRCERRGDRRRSASLHPIVGVERDATGAIARRAAPARGDRARVGHALRPRPPARRPRS